MMPMSVDKAITNGARLLVGASGATGASRTLTSETALASARFASSDRLLSKA